MLRYNKKISENIGILLHFMTNEWEWEENSTYKLHADMSKEDKKVKFLLY